MMEIGAKKTDVVTFESPITLVRKVKNSIAIIQDRSMMLCAPFSLNRAFTGIHHAKYTHTCPIEDITFIKTNTNFIDNPLIDPSQNPNGVPPETMLLIYDRNSTFYILDTARQVTVCSFTLPIKDRIISMTGSTVYLNIFVVVTPTSILKFEAAKGEAILLDSHEVWCRRVLPYNHNFILLSKDSVHVYADNSIDLLYSNAEIGNFCITDNREIVISRRDKNSLSTYYSIFEKINSKGPVIGMKNDKDQLWDTACDWIVALLSDDIMAVANLNVPNARTAIKMSSTIDVVKYMFAGIMKCAQAIGVLVIGSSTRKEKEQEWILELYQIPLANLNKLVEKVQETPSQ